MIVAYSGITTAFCGIWIFFAAVFAFMAVLCARRKKHRGELPKRLPVAVFTTFAAFVAVFVLLMVPVLGTAAMPAENGCDYVIVLGARVYSDRISTSLEKRLDRAFEYYLQNPETVFILSGGQGNGEPVPEALAMYNYLYRKGIPAENMRIEILSGNTDENIRLSSIQIEIDKQRHYRSSYPDRMKTGILTSDFHLYRSLGIAEKEGLTNVYPIAAPSDRILFVHLCVRESAAILKDHILGNLALRPGPGLFRGSGGNNGVFLPEFH
ncbi:MAG: YdcF family protein [Eubacteriales bacterium]|nr:YdcF family protein [Eubacteriales bacterium]